MTNQQGAPEALRLADALDLYATGDEHQRDIEDAAAELRRLHYENERLAALVDAQQPATHVQNPAGIEHVAGGVSKNGPESNMAQQPAPSAAVALSDDLRHRLVAISAAIADQDDRAAQAMLREILAAPQPSTTPPADSQPAPVVDKCTKQQMTTEVLTRMQQQEDGHNKNPFRSLLDRLMRNEGGYSTIEIGQLKYALDGFYGAARAPADSVTAPAGGVSEYTPMLDDEGRAMVGTSHHYTADNIRALVAEYKALEAGGPDTWELHCNTDHRARAGVLWRVISALADEVPFAPPTQAADSVLEDAALSSEQQRAIFEAYESAASESYFEVRPQIDCNDRRRVFKAGYERGWDAARSKP